MSTPNPHLISFLLLRKFVGILGCALPFVLAIGLGIIERRGLRDSISDYYWTVMGDVFVGILCAIAVFMLSYRGYGRQDARAGNIACLSAICVALLPVAPANPTPVQVTIGTLHYLSAVVFFLTLAYFSLKLFTKTDPSIPPTPRKLLRNRVYRACGWIIIACLAVIAVAKWLFPQLVGPWNLVFWLEAAAVVAFGVSWLTKGEAILADLP